MNFLTAFLAWMVVKVKNISLVNLVTGRRSVAELIQYNLTKSSLTREVRLLLEDQDTIKRMHEDYLEIRKKLGEKGASAKAARLIVSKLNTDINK